uniref:NADH dehydrogenase [ubiquinone] 1 beta subcomplex subunit 7 n=1 Tax=Anopheles dirus TaxID=7168 RepID=A0A182NH91_9DIPT
MHSVKSAVKILVVKRNKQNSQSHQKTKRFWQRTRGSCNRMGNYVSLYLTNPKGTPLPLTEPSFDPNLGFPNGRKERVMIATEEEMEAAKLPLEARDYCAHKLIQYRACRSDVWPWAYKCAHEKHEYLNCEYDDYILRLKEYEREKRLLQRKLKIEKKQAQELAA